MKIYVFGAHSVPGAGDIRDRPRETLSLPQGPTTWWGTDYNHINTQVDLRLQMMQSRSQLGYKRGREESMVRLEGGAGLAWPCRQALVDLILDLVLHEGQQQILKVFF